MSPKKTALTSLLISLLMWPVMPVLLLLAELYIMAVVRAVSRPFHDFINEYYFGIAVIGGYFISLAALIYGVTRKYDCEPLAFLAIGLILWHAFTLLVVSCLAFG